MDYLLNMHRVGGNVELKGELLIQIIEIRTNPIVIERTFVLSNTFSRIVTSTRQLRTSTPPEVNV